MDIIDKYNQEKETTIQYNLSELLHTDFSNNLRKRDTVSLSVSERRH